MPEAIRKMTSMPADLVLFDPAAVADRATFQKPLAISAGIRKVMVNGKLVWDEGKMPGILPGEVLR